ncbi:MAG: DUF433 domain-containing protein [Planctomycetota bacterium]
MIVTIPDDLTGFVVQSVSNGRYASADEAVAAGLRLLQQMDRNGNEPESQSAKAREAFFVEMTKFDRELCEQLEVRRDGAFVVRGHRVSVQLLLQAWSDGLSAAAIHERYPPIAMDVIERLVKFAAERPVAVARWLLVEETEAEHHCTEATRGPSLEELRRRLTARTAG